MAPAQGPFLVPEIVSVLLIVVMMVIMMVAIVPVVVAYLDHNLGLYRRTNCKNESEQQTQREDPAHEAEFQYFSPVCKAHSSCTSGDTIPSSLISLYPVRASID